MENKPNEYKGIWIVILILILVGVATWCIMSGYISPMSSNPVIRLFFIRLFS